ncbi:MAG: DUF1997 domain-containing protein [Gloeomargarita sp. SKYBB_i_bin120]|nr:DUF1997 domain-containing protein [Gloeomargarita sp. SKYB120]MDW8178629.1 DUF1997 domain-containing protein [Gloeomargarita sp. SKYBB_i_bin120]
MSEFTAFHSTFSDCMPMYAPAAVVGRYLDAHQAWFRRCADPMQAEPIGQTGYALKLGRFGALGYELEPCIGLDLLPADQQTYRIRTIPVPGFEPEDYRVDFQARLTLVETPVPADVQAELPNLTVMTRVEWVLDLGVEVRFPRFIQVLPESLIQRTGEALLRQVVRQISRRLTRRVQEDFHRSQGLPMPRPVHQFRWYRRRPAPTR